MFTAKKSKGIIDVLVLFDKLYAEVNTAWDEMWILSQFISQTATMTFTMLYLSFRMPAGHEKFLSIADLEGWGYANSDIRGYLAALTILQVRCCLLL